MGGVTLGRDVIVGEGSVLDIDTAMGDGSQLGHRSTLYTGQAVPAGERWHGSPGRRRRCGLCNGRRHALPAVAPGMVRRFPAPEHDRTLAAPCGQLCRAGRPGEPERRGTSGDAGVRVHRLGLLRRRRRLRRPGRLRWNGRMRWLIVTTPSGDAPTRAETRHGVSAVRAADAAAAGGGKDDQQSHARDVVRRQLVRRELRPGHRVQAAAGPAVRLELRHGVQARQPVPFDDRHRHDDRRRGVVHEHRLSRRRRSRSAGRRSAHTTSWATPCSSLPGPGPGTTACSRPR